MELEKYEEEVKNECNRIDKIIEEQEEKEKREKLFKKIVVFNQEKNTKIKFNFKDSNFCR